MGCQAPAPHACSLAVASALSWVSCEMKTSGSLLLSLHSFSAPSPLASHSSFSGP